MDSQGANDFRSRICAFLKTQEFPAKKTAYRCEYVGDQFVIFAPTENTKKVMLPLDLIFEWLRAEQLGIVSTQMDARTMRDRIKASSEWASALHGFETHLKAVVDSWAEMRSGQCRPD